MDYIVKLEKKLLTAKSSIFYFNSLREGEISAFIQSKPISSSRAEAREPSCCLGITSND